MNIKTKKIIAVTTGILAVVIFAVVLFIGRNSNNTKTDDLSLKSSEVQQNVYAKPVIEQDKANDNSDSSDTSSLSLVVDVGGKPINNNNNNSKTPAKETAKPVTASTPSQTNSSGGGIIIGGEEPSRYNCNTANHNCQTPEYHAYVLNLELQGCPYCGSHSCISFYPQEGWRPSICPQYDIKKDPAIYCQVCGRKGGDGRNNTCARYLTSKNCPYCNVWIESRTCHTCAN